MPLLVAAYTHSLIDGLLAGSPDDRDLLVRVREACLLNAPLEDRFRQKAARFRLAADDGEVLPDIRKVVLAAVHGEGEALFTVTPYTNSVDRAVADLVISRQKIRVAFAPDLAEEIINDKASYPPGPPDDGQWVRKTRPGMSDGPNVPPPSSN